MKIELETVLSIEYEKLPKIIEIDIDESSSSIGQLISQIHEMTNIPTNIELKWEDQIEKISCTYYFLEKTEFDEYIMITDLEEKIRNFPKHGRDGALFILIDGSTRLVN
ncbi:MULTISPECIES: hypothetical protein [Chryseobacterium]|uniref:hypothetical protein n=1 Tax=Chryseobacterium TaxID=59732 RepID=UPI00195BEFD1|nr:MULTISPECIES: hypothetical protein [Chryseobacterium]MBM7421638.1 hypothetical protein [Chryseobacterium sp. JUb44]MDH6211606.1 hypothetical protein [Chryseobacterium sp. BIGb0186]WSO10249.1 hypothetical protein VUJ64_20890 [Chryseobacterium scophthalmum]